jgi:hypothetical protein
VFHSQRTGGALPTSCAAVACCVRSLAPSASEAVEQLVSTLARLDALIAVLGVLVEDHQSPINVGLRVAENGSSPHRLFRLPCGPLRRN